MPLSKRGGVMILWFLIASPMNPPCIEAFGTLTRRPTFRIHGRENGGLFVAVGDDTTSAVSLRNDTSPLTQQADTTLPFDGVEWQEYEMMVRTVMDNRRIMKRKDKPEDVAAAMAYLLTNHSIVEPPNLASLSLETDARACMLQQKQDFLLQANVTELQHEFAMRTLTYLGDYCAKNRKPTALLVAWHKLVEAGMVPRENCISTYMYVLSLLSDNTNAVTQVATFHDLFYQPNEKTVTLRIKSMIGNNNAAGAEELLRTSVTDGEWKKLRTYIPVLELYCNQGDMYSALRLYRQMQALSRVHFEPDTYALLIGALAEQGYFARDSKQSLSGIRQKLSFVHEGGPGLLDELATEVAADILELNNASARVLYNGFVKGFSLPVPVLEPNGELVVNNTRAHDHELAVGRVSLNDQTAICPKTRAKLQLFQLDNEQRQSVHDTLLEMAGIQYEKFIQELEARFKQKMMQDGQGTDYAVQELMRFSDWLNEREGEPFTAIVDGANVAYHGHGTVHYSQVKFVVDELERMNETPLVIMPQKYTAPKFNINYGSKQELTERDMEVLKELNDTGKLYTVPSKCLDDYYWMLASTSNQTVASGGEWDMNVPISDTDGRFAGLRPMLVTNDQMRDHRWDLLEPRLFRRWCSCHIVNYNFSEFFEDEWAARDVEFCAADFCSAEIQGNPSPGSEVDSPSALAWHFPVNGWDEHDRLCIRVPI